MKSYTISLLLSLLFVAINLPAQDFKVIEETKDYILKVADSGYYYAHGLPPKDDFVLDTTKIHKVNGVLKLPLDNGKEVVFRDTVDSLNYNYAEYKFKGISKKLAFYLITQHSTYLGTDLIVHVNTGKIDTMVSSQSKLIYSPSFIYYCNYLLSWQNPPGGIIIIKNIKTPKKEISISLPGYYFDEIKWNDDKSFVCLGIYWDYKPPIKYYLIQIKQ